MDDGKKWPELMTVAEAAEVTRLSKMTIYRMISDGTLRGKKIGRTFRVSAASVRELVDMVESG